jgi:hypothetical protein
MKAGTFTFCNKNSRPRRHRSATIDSSLTRTVMKKLTPALVAAVLATALLAAPAAHARGHYHHHHHGAHFGVFVGAPLFPYYSPYYYRPYPYYYPPAVVVPPSPPVYIEQGQTVPNAAAAPAPSGPQAASGQTAYWYFCPDSQTYYPYVQQCASQWQQVEPQPQASTNPR